MLTTLIAFAVFSATGHQPEGPMTLVFLFPDEPVFYSLEQDMTNRQESDGQSVVITQSITNRLRSERISTSETGAIVLANTTESIRMQMSGPGIELDYDSDAPDEDNDLKNPTVASLAMMNGMQVQLLIQPNGEITEVVNIDEIEDTVYSMEDPDLMMGVAMMLNEETIIAVNEANYRLLPDRPVAVGDSWNHTFETPFPFGKVDMVMELTFEELVERGKQWLAQVSIGGSIMLDMGKNEAIRLEHTATELSGSFLFSINEGIVEAMSLRTNLNIEVLDAATDEILVSVGVKQDVQMERIEPMAKEKDRVEKPAEHTQP